MKHLYFTSIICLIICTSCGKSITTGNSVGGELIGEKSSSWAEPAPHGMLLIPRGSIEMGAADNDSLWDITANAKGISIDNFWIDETEVTNSMYRQFVNWVRDSITRERLADPKFADDKLGADETFKISTNAYGEAIKPYLNWKKAIPRKNLLDQELLAINSLTTVNPITKQRGIDPRQMNYIYEWFDEAEAAKRRNRLEAKDRSLNTDMAVSNEVVMISKDTAYFNEDGLPINETIVRPLSSLYDFLHTRIINIYPDTTVWVNDFKNAKNETYMRLYFSHPGYNDYPVVGVTWEQATAFCHWRTRYYNMGKQKNGRPIEVFRLPTEAEWEYTARNGRTENKYPWDAEGTLDDKGCFLANFKPGVGNYTKDGSLISARVASYSPNKFGIYDLAGNVAEWTSSAYTQSGNINISDVNPEYKYDAAKEDPYTIKKKVVKGGSWKDIGKFLRGDMRDTEYQNQPRSYIGFRCVRTQVGFAKSKK